MHNRDRALNILNYRPVDRMPAVHFGYWDELLDEWVAQGKLDRDLVEGYKARIPEYLTRLDEILGWDFEWPHCYNTKTNMKLYPPFEYKVLEELEGGTLRVQTEIGTIERIKPGIVSIPEFEDYLLKDRESFEKYYLPKMMFDKCRIDYDAYINYNENFYDKSNAPVALWIGSVIGDIRDMLTLEGFSYMMYDEDETLLADIVDAYADMQYKCIEEVLKTGAKFDYAHGWEDICYNSGPLLSPAIFDELCAKHYKKRTDLLHRYGIDIVGVDCDGVVDKLLPTWFDNGVNMMFPIEVGTWGDQFERARLKFGKGMLGVGGMDKTALRKDKKAVDSEIERLKRLSSLGGFIPCPDHRLMPGTDFELVKYYTEQIKKIKI